MPATFSYNPSYIFMETVGQSVDVIDYESGKETRLLRGLPQRVFTLNFDHVTKSTKDDILTFFNDQSGRMLSFYFTNPNDNITYEVYFIDDTISMTSDVYDYWNIELKLVQRMI